MSVIYVSFGPWKIWFVHILIIIRVSYLGIFNGRSVLYSIYTSLIPMWTWWFGSMQWLIPDYDLGNICDLYKVFPRCSITTSQWKPVETTTYSNEVHVYLFLRPFLGLLKLVPVVKHTKICIAKQLYIHQTIHSEHHQYCNWRRAYFVSVFVIAVFHFSVK